MSGVHDPCVSSRRSWPLVCSRRSAARRGRTGARCVDGAARWDGRQPLPAGIGALDCSGAFELRSAEPHFGGISGAGSTAELLLLSDRSRLFELAWPTPDAASRSRSPPSALVDGRGRPLDAEALAGRAATCSWPTRRRGGLLLRPRRSAEDQAARRRRLRGAAPRTRGWRPWRSCRTARCWRSPREVWRRRSHAAALLRWRGRAPGYRAATASCSTDADVAGDRLFVLERRLSLLGGWQGRVVAVPLAELQRAARVDRRSRARREFRARCSARTTRRWRLASDAGAIVLLMSRRQFQRPAEHAAAGRWRP